MAKLGLFWHNSTRSLRIFSNQCQLPKLKIDILEEPLQHLKTDLKPRAITKTIKKPIKDSFLKNLFLGHFETNLLLYPQINNKDTKRLHEYLKNIQDSFRKKISIVNELNNTNGDLSDIKKFKLLGLTVPHEYYGNEVSAMAIAYLAEMFSFNTSLGLTILAHNYFGVSGILLSENENLKREYLTKITKGDLFATLALNERLMGYDINNIDTQATVYQDNLGNKRYILNGHKTWITNAKKADIFITFAKIHDPSTSKQHNNSETPNKIMCFLIDKRKGCGNIIVGDNYEMVGLRGLDIADVKFENVDLGESDVITHPGHGFKLAYDIIGQTRFASALLYNGLIKSLIDDLLDKLNHKESFDRTLGEYPLIQERVGRLSTKLYAMQSLTYLVASLKDDYHEYDSELEDGLLRIYNASTANECLEELSDLSGREAYLTSSNIQRAWTDFKVLTAFEGSRDTARIHVSLTALKSVGSYYGIEIGKMRQPHAYPEFQLKYALFGLSSVGNMSTDPDSTVGRLLNTLSRRNLRLGDHLHPNHRIMAKNLEKRINDFNNLTRRILHVYAKEITHHQNVLIMLADYAAELLAVIAVMGRSSRSFCIGLRNCDTELLMANAFCRDAWKKMDAFKDKIGEIVRLGDENEIHRRIGKTLLQGNEYNIAHPLQKNW